MNFRREPVPPALPPVAPEDLADVVFPPPDLVGRVLTFALE